MKNVQVIDGAVNCTFSIFQATDAEFAAIFPAPGQDIEFAEDFIARVGEAEAGMVLGPIWERPIEKQNANGIHGTLFYEFEAKKTHFPKSKRERDWSHSALNDAQRRLYSGRN